MAEWSEDRLSTSWEHTTSVQLHTGTWASSWRWSFGELSTAIGLMSLVRVELQPTWSTAINVQGRMLFDVCKADRFFLGSVLDAAVEAQFSDSNSCAFRCTSPQWNLVPAMTWVRRCLCKRFAALAGSGPLSTSHVCMLRALCVIVSNYLISWSCMGQGICGAIVAPLGALTADHLWLVADDFSSPQPWNFSIHYALTGSERIQWPVGAVSRYCDIHVLCKIDEASIKFRVRLQVRISVKFLKGWPVIGRVRLCFASKPQVTMSYRPIDRNGIDVSLIPVFANVVVS